MPESYLFFKMLHVLGVVLFLGNIIVTVWWKTMANRHGDPMVIAFAQRQVTLTDYIFTFSGVVLILIGANTMFSTTDSDTTANSFMSWGGWLFSDVYWVARGGLLFVISGIIWVAILIPIQVQQARMAKVFERGCDIPDKYWRLNTYWIFWGLLATFLPLLNLYLMIFKPQGA